VLIFNYGLLWNINDAEGATQETPVIRRRKVTIYCRHNTRQKHFRPSRALLRCREYDHPRRQLTTSHVVVSR